MVTWRSHDEWFFCQSLCVMVVRPSTAPVSTCPWSLSVMLTFNLLSSQPYHKSVLDWLTCTEGMDSKGLKVCM